MLASHSGPSLLEPFGHVKTSHMHNHLVSICLVFYNYSMEKSLEVLFCDPSLCERARAFVQSMSVILEAVSADLQIPSRNKIVLYMIPEA